MTTDFFDGKLARRHGRSSPLGSLLDPIADKVLVLGALTMLVGLGVVPAWMVATIVVREVLITGLRQAAIERGIVIAARDLGKLKTWAQAIAAGVGGFAAAGGMERPDRVVGAARRGRADVRVGTRLRAKRAGALPAPRGSGVARRRRRGRRTSRCTAPRNGGTREAGRSPLRSRRGRPSGSGRSSRARRRPVPHSSGCILRTCPGNGRSAPAVTAPRPPRTPGKQPSPEPSSRAAAIAARSSSEGSGVISSSTEEETKAGGEPGRCELTVTRRLLISACLLSLVFAASAAAVDREAGCIVGGAPDPGRRRRPG